MSLQVPLSQESNPFTKDGEVDISLSQKNMNMISIMQRFNLF